MVCSVYLKRCSFNAAIMWKIYTGDIHLVTIVLQYSSHGWSINNIELMYT